MDKFSLYDLLGLLLPGVILVWMVNLLNSFYGFLPFPIIPADWTVGIWILLCLALIAGAMLYAVNFWLVEKGKIYLKLTGIYKPVADLYLEMHPLHQIMNGALNYKARKWYNREIFFDADVFNGFGLPEQEQLKALQDKYYDRMYYELDYHGKMEQAKTFQSFYFFFRQLVSVCWLLAILSVLLQLVSLIPASGLKQPPADWLVWLIIFLLAMLCLSVAMARWYRKRMVKKMYWAYFTHLNQTLNQ